MPHQLVEQFDVKRTQKVGQESGPTSRFAAAPVAKIADDDALGPRPKRASPLKQFQPAEVGQRQMTEQQIKHGLGASQTRFRQRRREHHQVSACAQIVDLVKRLAKSLFDQQDVQRAQGHLPPRW